MPSVADRGNGVAIEPVASSSASPSSSSSSSSSSRRVQASLHALPTQSPAKHAVLSRELWQSVFGAERPRDSPSAPTISVEFPRRCSPSSSSRDSQPTTLLYTAHVAGEEQAYSQSSSAHRLWLSSIPPQYSGRLNTARDDHFMVHVQECKPIVLSSVILSTSSESLLDDANGSDSALSNQINNLLAMQGDTLALPLGHVNVLQTEPVIQGIITATTDVLLAFDPHAASEQRDITDTDSAQSVGDDFAIDEQFLAQSVLQGFDAHLVTENEEEEEAPMALKDQSILTFHPASIENRQSLLDAISSWRDSDHSAPSVDEESAILLSQQGLGSIGAFHGDWVIAELVGHDVPRLVRIFSSPEIRSSQMAFLPPLLFQNLHSPGRFDPCPPKSPALRLVPVSNSTPRDPSTAAPLACPLPIPFADSLTIARIPSALSVNRTYQTLFLDALRRYFEGQQRILKQGDVIAVGVNQGKVRWVAKKSSDKQGQDQQQAGKTDTADSSDSSKDVEPSKFDFSEGQDDKDGEETPPTGVVHFSISSLTCELSSPSANDDAHRNEADFEVRSLARNGHFGAVVDASLTKMVQTGVVGTRVIDSTGWLGVAASRPALPAATGSTLLTSPTAPFGRMCQLIQATLLPKAAMYGLHLSVVVKGARGSGKKTAIHWATQRTGVHLIEVNCFDVLGDTDTQTEGTLRARFESAASCGPAVLVLYNVDALARKSQAVETGQEPAMSNVLRDCIEKLKVKVASTTPYQPVAVFGTTSDAEKCPDGVLACFKHEIAIEAPNEAERAEILAAAAQGSHLSPDANLKDVATQTAALVAADLVDLVGRARLASIERVKKAFPDDTAPSTSDLSIAGVALTGADFDAALNKARANYSESIGAPKIPNVTWDDVGGLASVKSDILDTIQLPLEHPELFSDGLKKRSGILLYGPPGTGKTLLAKAVATSCSLNFFSVKGPELLNMYIGESEANVRRVFQRARDAKPCVIFFDELDSVAPKRGNQGDSGGVMDRIVSQLLAELDGMAGSKEGTDVFVIGATNRPDLLDPALLRPGRFDRMLYLSVSETHAAQLNILQALTRKFKLDSDVGDLGCIAEQCPFNLTGADFYALCSDAMLKAMTRKAAEVDEKIATINATPPNPNPHPHPMTPQYYLSELASAEEIQVKVSRADFESALRELVPSVSEQEMEHYRRVQAQFSGPRKDDGDNQTQSSRSGGTVQDLADAQSGRTMQELADQMMALNASSANGTGKGKGKGKAREVDAAQEFNGQFHPPIEAPSIQPANGPVNGVAEGASEGAGQIDNDEPLANDASQQGASSSSGNVHVNGNGIGNGSGSGSGKGKGKKKDKGKGRA